MEEIGLWKSAFDLYKEPSRDWIGRVHKQGKKIFPVNRLTVVAIQSGYRKDSYKNRSQDEHELVFRQLYSPGFREEILTYLCYQLSLRAQTLSVLKLLKAVLLRPVKWAMIHFDLDPTGLLRFFRHRKKGGHIDKLRKMRGLAPIKNKNDVEEFKEK